MSSYPSGLLFPPPLPPSCGISNPLCGEDMDHNYYVLEPHVQSNYSVQEKLGKLCICFRTFLVLFCFKMNGAVS